MDTKTPLSPRSLLGVVARPQAQVMSRAHENGALLVDRRSGACFELNTLGAHIWALLDGERALGGVLARLLPTVAAAEDRLAQDLSILISALATANLVELNDLEPRDRFLITQFGAESIVTDLARGTYFRANASATRVFASLATGTPPPEPQQTVDDLLSFATGQPSPAVDDDEPFAFRPFLGHFRLFEKGRPLLDVQAEDGLITFVASISADAVSRDSLELWLRLAGTKQLAHQGLFCLHASSVSIGNGVLAIAGRSGAGKTSTARAFAAAGGTLLTEDLLSVEHVNGQIQIRPNAEHQLRDWARDTASEVQKQGLHSVRLTGLWEAIAKGGPTRGLDHIWVLAADRRRGTDFSTERLSPIDAFTELLPHVQLGSDDMQTWRDHMAKTSALALSLPLFRASAPDGLAALAKAAIAYAEKTRS